MEPDQTAQTQNIYLHLFFMHHSRISLLTIVLGSVLLELLVYWRHKQRKQKFENCDNIIGNEYYSEYA